DGHYRIRRSLRRESEAGTRPDQAPRLVQIPGRARRAFADPVAPAKPGQVFGFVGASADEALAGQLSQIGDPAAEQPVMAGAVELLRFVEQAVIGQAVPVRAVVAD